MMSFLDTVACSSYSDCDRSDYVDWTKERIGSFLHTHSTVAPLPLLVCVQRHTNVFTAFEETECNIFLWPFKTGIDIPAARILSADSPILFERKKNYKIKSLLPFENEVLPSWRHPSLFTDLIIPNSLCGISENFKLFDMLNLLQFLNEGTLKCQLSAKY